MMRREGEFDEKEFERRVRAALGGKKDLRLAKDTLAKYRKYLEANLTIPCVLTGIEDFLWEEFYVLGPGDKAEYEELKKTNASYTDQFEWIGFEDGFGGMEGGLLVKVRRISDRKRFVLPLDELKVVDKKSANYQLVDDYAVWAVNY